MDFTGLMHVFDVFHSNHEMNGILRIHMIKHYTVCIREFLTIDNSDSEGA